MAVFRVEKTQNYTVMSNHHLRNDSLTLKAKGLLSQMLSLPEEWDYTLVGLSHINRERIDAIREAVKELERAGYVTRSRVRDSKGRMTGTEYVIREVPRTEPDELPPPTLDFPTLDYPTLENPTLENPTQLSKEGTIKERLSKDPSMGLKGKESSLQREILHEMTRRPKLCRD
jgi:hypothetical protein